MKARNVVVVLVLAGLVSACGTEPSRDRAARAAEGALRSVTAPATSTTTAAANATPTTCDPHDPAPSLRPPASLPAPGRMPAGTFMRTIQDRGYLIAGVDQNTLGFGYRNTAGEIVGFDIDLLREVARAIFGTPDAIQFRAVTTAQRQTAIVDNQVDLVASAMSITCDRWKQFDFSTEYYEAAQKVLVRADSPIKHVADLNGKRVCATRHSTSIDQIHQFAPRAKLYPVDLRTECLVALQEGFADAISTDDTILYGLALQDRRSTRLLPDDLHQPERYGIGINQAHPEFVRFVNGVLDAVRSDGRWTAFHRTLEAELGIQPTVPPPPEYRD